MILGVQKPVHYLAGWGAWYCNSVIGVFGTFANSFLLYIFYSERRVLASSVNAMIAMDTLHRILFTLVIHWRTVALTRAAIQYKLNLYEPLNLWQSVSIKEKWLRSDGLLSGLLTRDLECFAFVACANVFRFRQTVWFD